MKNQQSTRCLKLRPLTLALLASLPVFAQPTRSPSPIASSNSSAAPGSPTLPDLDSQSGPNLASIRPGPNGVTFANSFDGKSISVTPEYSDKTGWSIGATLASMLGDKAAVGLLLSAGADKNEVLINAGFQVDAHQRIIVTVGRLEQFLDYAFRSGSEVVGMTQISGAVNYQLQLGSEFLRFLELNGYVAQTASRDLAGKTFTVDTATLYELWNEPRRVAGSSVTGLQLRLGFSPISGSTVKVSLGQERLSYDLLAGSDNVGRFTGGLEWVQQLGSGYQFKLAAESFASQNSTTLAVERSLRGFGGRHNFGLSLVALRGRDGLGDDNQIKLTYTYLFGAAPPVDGSRRLDKAQVTMQPAVQPLRSTSSVSSNTLLRQVAVRPSVIPSHVVARVDNTAVPTRLIAVDKTALPLGANVNTTTGDITAPLNTVVSGIAGITKNLVVFVNTGQFSLSGNSLVIRPGLIVQPAVGVVDSYVVTINNQGGGTTLATVQVSRGSVQIDSITVSNGVAADTTAPVNTVAPSVSGTTHTATTLSATLNEAGTGYYLVQAAAAAVPTVAQVQAGTAFAMTANVAATPAITGLTASTAYKVYFVAKDAAGNVQAAVQSVAVTTTAAPDLTAPTTTAAPSISGTTDTATTLSATINEAGTGYYLVQAAAAAVPTVAQVQAGTAFAMTANVAATPAIAGLTASTAYKVYFVAKDAVGNVQAAVQSVTVTTGAALAAPTASGVSISGTAQVGQVLTGSYTYTDANSDPQGTSTYRWLRNGVAIGGATASSYTLVAADQGTAITFEVTPVSSVAPTTGTPVVSSATASVAGAGAAAAPTASGVSISGTAQVGQVLTGSYTYADANSDAQGTSTYRWLRNGVAIAGATASSYTLVAADQGTTITFEVTPVSSVAPTTGVPVVSAATASVAGAGAVSYPHLSGARIYAVYHAVDALT